MTEGLAAAVWRQLAQQRKARNISAAHAARAMEKDWSTIHRWERDGNGDLDSMHRYVDRVLNCNLVLNFARREIALIPKPAEEVVLRMENGN